MQKSKLQIKVKNKQKSVQGIQDEIFRKMPADKKIRLALKLSSEFFKPIKDKIKLQYPNLHPVLLSQKIYNYIDLRRGYYDKLFNKRLEKELRTKFNFKNYRN